MGAAVEWQFQITRVALGRKTTRTWRREVAPRLRAGRRARCEPRANPRTNKGTAAINPPVPPTAVCQSVTVRLQSRTPTTPTKNGFAVW